MSAVFFVHIPKTAGTSFRKACEAYFGEDKVLYDYHPDMKETSEMVKEWVYQKNDYIGLDSQLSSSGKKFLSGHVPAIKYVHLLGVANTIAFVRDPVQRVVSEYHHHVRHNGYGKELRTFYLEKHAINRQSRMLNRVPLEAVGFVGLTEAYERSLVEINSRYGVTIKSVQLNQGRSDQQSTYELDDETLTEIRHLNADDLRFYEHAERLFQQRTQLFDEGKSYTHGLIQEGNANTLRGWAWYAAADKPVEVAVCVNGHEDKRIVAKDIRPGILQLSPPRKGYVGFHHKFSKPLKKNDSVECVVASTGQVIGRYTV